MRKTAYNMRMVKQRNNSDCCIASIANAVGVPYAVVKERFGKLDRGGMQPHELRWILGEFGEWHFTKIKNPVPISRWVQHHQAGRFVLVLDKIFTAHAVAVVDGQIIGDSSPEWKVVEYYRLNISE